MAGIKQPILDVMTRLATITDFKTVRIWNNHVKYMEKGKLYAFPLPAVFVEVVNAPVYEVLGLGFQTSDIAFNIHIIHEFYDAEDGSFEQDLVVFDLRDKVIHALTLFEPTACGPLVLKSETQDYDHNNVYHYTPSFAVNFIDSKGSKYDPAYGNYVDKNPPTGLDVTATKENAQVDPNAQTETVTRSEKYFNIPQ